MSDEVRLHGVTVGRVRAMASSVRIAGAALSAKVSFTPDHVGIMHASARALDKGEDR